MGDRIAKEKAKALKMAGFWRWASNNFFFDCHCVEFLWVDCVNFFPLSSILFEASDIMNIQIDFLPKQNSRCC